MISESHAVATIANGQALSAGVNLQGGRLFALQLPASWTAADLTFQASFDGSTYADMFDEEGNEVTVDAAASRYILLDPARWLGVRNLKIRSGAAGAPVNQGGDRVIQLLLVS